jgi:hypothetical protein
MKTKLPWFLLAFLGVVVIASHAQNQPPAGAPQRYQLFSAATGPAVFRLDTQTGETAIYREGFLPNDSRQFRYNYWQPIDDRWIVHDTVEEARQAQSAPR